MKFRKLILSSLLILSTFFVINGQEPQVSPTPQSIDDGLVCAIRIDTEMIVVNVSVVNNENLFVEDLTNWEFEVYNKKEKQEIDFFYVDKLKNQYKIGFTPKHIGEKYSFKNIKVKLKLPKEKKKQYGKVFIIRK